MVENSRGRHRYLNQNNILKKFRTENKLCSSAEPISVTFYDHPMVHVCMNTTLWYMFVWIYTVNLLYDNV